MKLTKYMKECIVGRILADVPERNFQAEAEALVMPAVLARLPKDVRKVVDNPNLANFVKTARAGTNCGALYVQIPAQSSYLDSAEKIDAMGAETWEAFQALCAENRSAKEGRAALKRQLAANFASISTRKQFVERYPELATYAPEDREAVANLPATTALIDTLKAAGLSVQEA
jgi:hypothetical protein